MKPIRAILFLCIILTALPTKAEVIEDIAYGNFNSWVVREIKESAIIGGNTKTVYEIGPNKLIKGDIPYSNENGDVLLFNEQTQQFLETVATHAGSGALDEKDAVTKIGEPGGKTYYQLKKHHHKHQLECVGCHKHITINQCPLEAFSCMLNKETGFVITEHHLQIKGICPECAKNINR